MAIDNTDKINAIRAILQEGASSVVVDGVAVTYDLNQLRRELRLLMLEDDNLKGARPVASTIKLGGLF